MTRFVFGLFSFYDIRRLSHKIVNKLHIFKARNIINVAYLFNWQNNRETL